MSPAWLALALPLALLLRPRRRAAPVAAMVCTPPPEPRPRPGDLAALRLELQALVTEELRAPLAVKLSFSGSYDIWFAFQPLSREEKDLIPDLVRSVLNYQPEWGDTLCVTALSAEMCREEVEAWLAERLASPPT